MMSIGRSLGFVCVNLSLLVGAGCSSHHRGARQIAGAAAGDVVTVDPSVRITLRASEVLTENATLAGQPGVVRVFDVAGTHNHMSLYFTARAEATQFKNLGEYAAWADSMLKEREIRDLEVTAAHNPIRDAGLPFVARTYVNVQRPGAPAPTAICDAAGLRFETPGGFWTISWNSDLGKIAASTAALDELLRVMDIQRVDGAAAPAAATEVLGPGSKAPALDVKEWIRGDPVAVLSPERTYVVEFWATWCGPCMESIPHLTELARKYRDVRFIGISILEENDKGQVQEFVAKMGDKMGYTVGYAGNKEGMAKSWMAAAKQSGIPTAFLVRGGEVVWIGHPVELDRPLGEMAKGEFDLGAEQKRFEAKLAARDAAAKRAAQIEECARLFDAGERSAAKEMLAKVEETPRGKEEAEELRSVWLCVEDPGAWREKMGAEMAASTQHGSEFAMFAVANAGRAPEQCKWLIAELTSRFPENWYTWLCGARLSRALGEHDAALAHAQRSREAVLEFQRQNPDVPKGNALDVIKALEDEVRAAKGS